MRLVRFVVNFALLCPLAACDVADPVADEAPTFSKEEAAQLGGKTDLGGDICAAAGWYGDAICDAFCLLPDPDCGSSVPSFPMLDVALHGVGFGRLEGVEVHGYFDHNANDGPSSTTTARVDDGAFRLRWDGEYNTASYGAVSALLFDVDGDGACSDADETLGFYFSNVGVHEGTVVVEVEPADDGLLLRYPGSGWSEQFQPAVAWDRTCDEFEQVPGARSECEHRCETPRTSAGCLPTVGCIEFCEATLSDDAADVLVDAVDYCLEERWLCYWAAESCAASTCERLCDERGGTAAECAADCLAL